MERMLKCCFPWGPWSWFRYLITGKLIGWDGVTLWSSDVT